MIDPIEKTIEVHCSPERAFTVFVHGMGTWWPLDKRSMSMKGGRPAQSLHVEPRIGGKIVETGHDGTRHLWGTITSYDPHALVSMDFHMGMPPDAASLLEVRFIEVARNRTRVELTQSNWEAFGGMAEILRGHYDSSWTMLFEQAFKPACGAERTDSVDG